MHANTILSLQFFQKFQSRTAHQRKFQLFFEANSLILCQHLLGFFNHLKPASKCWRNFLYCVSKKKALQKYLHAKIDTKWVCVKKRNMAKIAQNYTNTRNSCDNASFALAQRAAPRCDGISGLDGRTRVVVERAVPVVISTARRHLGGEPAAGRDPRIRSRIRHVEKGGVQASLRSAGGRRYAFLLWDIWIVSLRGTRHRSRAWATGVMCGIRAQPLSNDACVVTFWHAFPTVERPVIL